MTKSPSRAGSPDEWRAELNKMFELRDAATTPQMKETWGQLIDELTEALANPNHPINTQKEVG